MSDSCVPGSDLYNLRHSTAHLMAQAIGELFPGVKYAIGPPIEDGFYYDFDLPEPIREEDLSRIEDKMRELAKQDFAITREVMPRPLARDFEVSQNQPYKVELIDDLPEGEEISFYRQGDWIDLCRGPHVPSTKVLQHFKLLHTAGAYWRGSEKNKMLTRVYGTAWQSQADLDAYLNRLEEARKRDHRVLGRELGLFVFSAEHVGAGIPLFLPKGEILRHTMETLCARGADAIRLSARLDGSSRARRPVQEVGALRQLQGRHVPSHGGQGSGHQLSLEADELPEPHDAVQSGRPESRTGICPCAMPNSPRSTATRKAAN